MTFTDEESGIKATVDVDEESGEFIFDMNGEPWENHVFLDESFALDDTQVKLFHSKITLNGKVVVEGYNEWDRYSLQHKIWKKIDDKEPLTDIRVELVKDTDTKVLNEVLGQLVVQENIPEDGLKHLVFNDWRDVSEPLDSSVV